MALDKITIDSVTADIISITNFESTFDSTIASKSTADLPEGSNLYFTNERVDDRVANLIKGGTNITVTYDDAAGTFTIAANSTSGYDLTSNDTDDLAEGTTNLYYTNTRVSSYLANNNITVQNLTINSDYELANLTTIGASTSAVVIYTFDYATYDGSKFVIKAKDTVTGYKQISEFVVTHDGVDAYATEYGTVYTGLSQLITYQVQINGSNVELTATSTNTNSTEYITAGTLFYS